MGSFIKVELAPKEQVEEDVPTQRRWMRTLRHLNRRWIPNLVVVVVAFDAISTCLSIDFRAADNDLLRFIHLLMDFCVLFYTFEFIVNVILKGRKHLQDWMTWVDVVVLICGYLEIFTRLFPRYPAELELAHNLRVLRLVRIFRLTNFLRKARSLRELQKMVTMLSTCLKTLAWSFVFCFGMMTIWSMLMVELVHPITEEMYAESPTDLDIADAYASTASIMAANLLLFKTVIAGDSWGRFAVPIIRREPFTALIFCGSLMTLVFGVLNLIVAVIVDTFAEARERDIMNLAQELELSHEDDKKFLRKMFDRLDVEGHGEVTLDDLVKGARQDPEFQSRLRVMDIDEVDLEQLFYMIDADGSGTVEADEFIAPLSRWVHESKTATRFIKYNLMRAMHQQEDFFTDCQREIEEMACRIRELTNFIEGMSSQSAFTNQASLKEDRNVSPPTESMDSMELLDFVAAPDVEIEQPKVSKKEMTTDLLRAALETAERRLAAGTEEALKRSLHILEGVLQDVFRDLSLEYLDGEKSALLHPSRRLRLASGRSPSKDRGDRGAHWRSARRSQSEGVQAARSRIKALPPGDPSTVSQHQNI